MRHGDISNRAAPAVAFRVEDFLIEYKEQNLKDKALNLILGKDKRAEINPLVLSVIGHIYRHTDMSVDLIVGEEADSSDLRNKLVDVPYNRIIVIDKPVRVAISLNCFDFDYYVDNNLERISIIGHSRCMTFEQFRLLVFQNK